MDFIPKKSLGQHFLNNEHVPRKMADAAGVKKGDNVLEIGPGTGVLTRELLLRGATVYAIETDHRAIEVLRNTFASEILAQQLVILDADVREKSPGDLGFSTQTYKVVANIPYYLSGMLFRRFLETEHQPTDLVFLVQKEVAWRIARDKKESLLSMSVKVYGTPRYVETVKKGNFTPSPKVDSAIIAVSEISHDRFEGLDESFFFEILHLGFAAKRKQLLGNLSKKFDRQKLSAFFSELGLSPSVRGEDVTVDAWITLSKQLAVHIQSPVSTQS